MYMFVFIHSLSVFTQRIAITRCDKKRSKSDEIKTHNNMDILVSDVSYPCQCNCKTCLNFL